MNWEEVVYFCVTSKCIPTLLFYEEQRGKARGEFDKYLVNQDSIDMLQIQALEQD